MSRIKCPTCGKQFDSQQSPAMPFCSSRCRQIDLGRWISQDYAIPGRPLDSDPEEAAAAGEDVPGEPPED